MLGVLMFSKSNQLVITALVTPFDASGEIDYASLAQLIELQIKEGADGLVVLGTTAEAATLSREEKIKVLKFVKDHVPSSMPLIAGVGSNATQETILQHQAVKDLGYSASLIVTPYYNNPNTESILAHYTAINEHVDFPFILYHVPSRTGSKMSIATAQTILNLSHCIGIKDATGSLAWSQLIMHGGPYMLSGDDLTTPQYHQLGGHGVISVLSNASPVCMREYLNNPNQKTQALIDALGCDTNPVPIKWFLYHKGIIASPYVRLPLMPLNVDRQSIIKSADYALDALNA